mmetsp:Transcript_9219/g.20567  ORF Transcript_9219/g.20567 Transcript_9219/m.20567 type:complete len:211 (-) Transcript_9219:1791-2423(-)
MGCYRWRPEAAPPTGAHVPCLTRQGIKELASRLSVVSMEGQLSQIGVVTRQRVPEFIHPCHCVRLDNHEGVALAANLFTKSHSIHGKALSIRLGIEVATMYPFSPQDLLADPLRIESHRHSVFLCRVKPRLLSIRHAAIHDIYCSLRHRAPHENQVILGKNMLSEGTGRHLPHGVGIIATEDAKERMRVQRLQKDVEHHLCMQRPREIAK